MRMIIRVRGVELLSWSCLLMSQYDSTCSANISPWSQERESYFGIRNTPIKCHWYTTDTWLRRVNKEKILLFSMKWSSDWIYLFKALDKIIPPFLIWPWDISGTFHGLPIHCLKVVVLYLGIHRCCSAWAGWRIVRAPLPASLSL